MMVIEGTNNKTMSGSTVMIDQEQMKDKQEEDKRTGKDKEVNQGITIRGPSVVTEAKTALPEKIKEEENIEMGAIIEDRTIEASKETVSREMGAETGMKGNKEALRETGDHQ
jgi:hypothetical protein